MWGGGGTFREETNILCNQNSFTLDCAAACNQSNTPSEQISEYTSAGFTWQGKNKYLGFTCIYCLSDLFIIPTLCTPVVFVLFDVVII